jgi:hypothetical protein
MVATFSVGVGPATMTAGCRSGAGEVSAVWLRTTAQLRGRVQLTVLLALLVGLAGGLVLAALAGARRSDAALPRFLAFNQTTDAMVWVVPRSGSFFDDRSHLGQERRVVAGLPGVRSTTRGSVIIVSGTDPASPAGPRRQTAVVALDPGGGDLAGRPMVIAGRLTREDRADEATIDEELAQRRGLRVGSTYRIGTYTMAQFGPVGEGVPIRPDGPTVELRITGIVRHPNDLTPPVDGDDDFDTDETSGLYLTPAFWHRYGPDLAKYGIFISVELDRGPDGLAAFTEALQRRFGDRAFINNAFDEPGDAYILGTQRAIALETAALLGFAALAALAGVLLVGQALARQVLVEATEYPTLRALGMTRGQLVAVALIRAVVVAGGGAAIAVATAVALSPLTPIGVGRRAELDPGIAVDQPVLAVGGVAIILLVAVCAALPAWRAAAPPAPALGSSTRPAHHDPPGWPAPLRRWPPDQASSPAFGWLWNPAEAEPPCPCGRPWPGRRRPWSPSPRRRSLSPAWPTWIAPIWVRGVLGPGRGQLRRRRLGRTGRQASRGQPGPVCRRRAGELQPARPDRRTQRADRRLPAAQGGRVANRHRGSGAAAT